MNARKRPKSGWAEAGRESHDGYWAISGLVNAEASPRSTFLGLTNWIAALVLGLVPLQAAWPGAVRTAVKEANRLYAKGDFNGAVEKCDEALLERPQAMEPRFNKANAYYRLDDLSQAMDLYNEVAAESKDMSLVTKAKYNLGNCYFQRGSKQRDSNLQKALEDFKTSITHWRQVLDIDPENKKAAKNIEVARLVIKDIIDQLNKEKQQQQQQGQSGQQDQQDAQQQQSQQGAQQDPNEPEDPNQPQNADQAQDPNNSAQQQKPEQQEQEREAVASDSTAQEILDKEQRQKQQRQILQRARYQKVDKDW